MKLGKNVTGEGGVEVTNLGDKSKMSSSFIILMPVLVACVVFILKMHSTQKNFDQ